MTELDVRVRRLPHAVGLPLPTYHSELASGFDLLAAIDGDLSIAPAGWAAVPTGLCLALAPGTEGQVRPRSGLAARYGLTVLNAPGTIDADYRGEVQVLLVNLGAEPFTITRGMRIAQMIVAPVTMVDLVEVAVVNETARAGGGFGSTGLG